MYYHLNLSISDNKKIKNTYISSLNNLRPSKFNKSYNEQDLHINLAYFSTEDEA